MKHLPAPLRWLIVLGMKAVAMTLRVRMTDPNDEMRVDGHVRIYALWHNRLVMLPAISDPKRRSQVVFLASRSRDGGYIADILGGFGMRAIRGSSSKGGAAALRTMQQSLGKGNSVALTPDGPRGPKYEIQDGAVWLAAKMGLPIVPVAVNTAWHIELKSWDNTQLPLPFSPTELRFGEPVTVPENLTKADLPAQKARIREAMLAVCWGDHQAEPSLEETSPTV